MNKISVCISFLIIGLIVGCGSQPERFAVAGTVMLDGMAIGECTLVFRSMTEEGSTGIASVNVLDGKFEIPRENGLMSGEYGVVLTELQPDLDEYEAARNTGLGSGLIEKFIPPKYTASNELRIQIKGDMQPISIDLKSR